MRKALDKIKPTPQLLEYYKAIGDFLKLNPEIEYKKLTLGFQVNIATIPKNLVDEWIKLVTNKS
jgi:hypothetical protein